MPNSPVDVDRAQPPHGRQQRALSWLFFFVQTMAEASTRRIGSSHSVSVLVSARGSLGAHASRRPATVLERRQGFQMVRWLPEARVSGLWGGGWGGGSVSSDIPPSLALKTPHVLSLRHLLTPRTAFALTPAAAIYVSTRKNVSTHTAVG